MRKWKKKNRRIDDDDACCKRIGYQRNQRPSDRPCGMGSCKNRRYGTVFSPGRSGGMSYQRRRAGFPGNSSYFAGNSGQSGRCRRFIRRLGLRPGGRRRRHEMPRKTRYRLRYPCLPCSSGVSVLYFRSGLRQRDPPPGRVPGIRSL